MSATHPEADRGRAPNRRQEAHDQTMAAIEYGLEALKDRLDEYTVRQAQSVQAIMLRGARAVPIGATPGGTLRASTSAGSLIGWALHNTGGAVAQVNLLDGPDAGGDLIAPITLNVGESTRDNWGPGGLSFQRGLFVQLVTGTLEGCLFLRGPT